MSLWGRAHFTFKLHFVRKGKFGDSTEVHRGEVSVKVEEEIQVTQLQIKEHKELPSENHSSSAPPEGTNPTDLGFLVSRTVRQ